MNTTLKLAGAATAACAACCAVGVVPAVLAGTSLVAIGGATFTWGLWIAALAVPVIGLYFLSRREAAPNANFQTLMAVESCGCGPSCDTAAREEKPIACTLDAGDFKERAVSIRDLAWRSLRHSSRTPLTLTLTYEPGALDEVRDLVAKEKTCCAFLSFDLKHNTSGVFVTVTAPKSAAEAADVLFDHFAPEFRLTKLKETV
ncbi:MAG: hypothetical protein WBA88_02465 [Pseudaminobacter sp.]|jgi:hypothetical protein